MVGNKRFLAAIAALHLAIAAAFAPHVPLEPYLPRAVNRPLALYGTLSGVHTHFDFFAPSVATQARARFSLQLADGASRDVVLATSSAEVNNRLAMMLTFYADPRERGQMLEGLARYMLRANPGAAAVEVRIELLDIPALARDSAPLAAARWVEAGRLRLRREDALLD